MAGNHHDVIFRSGKFRDEAAHLKFASGSIRGKRVLFYRVSLEMSRDVVFHFLVIGAAERTRAEGDNLFYVAHGSLGINRRQRAAIGR